MPQHSSNEANDSIPGQDALSTPWHFRIVESVLLLWSIWAFVGFVMTTIKNKTYLSNFPPEMLTVLATLPSWALAARACGIFTSVAAAILLTRRSRHAFSALVVVLSCLAMGTIGEEIIGLPHSITSGFMLVAKFSNWAILIGLVCYTHWLRLKNILR